MSLGLNWTQRTARSGRARAYAAILSAGGVRCPRAPASLRSLTGTRAADLPVPTRG